jgi:hypothetical protein
MLSLNQLRAPAMSPHMVTYHGSGAGAPPPGPVPTCPGIAMNDVCTWSMWLAVGDPRSAMPDQPPPG